jgi:hypothetical protein
MNSDQGYHSLQAAAKAMGAFGSLIYLNSIDMI